MQGPVSTEDPGPVKRHTVRRVVSTFRPYRGKVSIVGALIVLTATLGIVNPLLIKQVFDKALFCTNGCVKLHLLFFFVGLMVVIPIVSGLLGIAQTFLANVVGLSVMKDLRNALYRHLQRMPLRFFTTTRTGEIQSRLVNDVAGPMGGGAGFVGSAGLQDFRTGCAFRIFQVTVLRHDQSTPQWDHHQDSE